MLCYLAKGLYIRPHSVKYSKLFCIPRNFWIHINSVLKAKYGVLLNSAEMEYEVAMLSRLLQIIGFFCRIWSLLEGSFAKETCNFKEPTNRSSPIPGCCTSYWTMVAQLSTFSPSSPRSHTAHTATHCNTLQHTATHCNTWLLHFILDHACPTVAVLRIYSGG